MTSDEYRDELHHSGVHVRCRLAPAWAGRVRIGDGTSNSCPRAGTVEKIHDHDYEGPLVCGCADLG